MPCFLHVSRINKADIEKYVADHYKPGRMVLAGAGGVDHDSLVRLAEKYFGQMKNVDAPYKSERAPKFTGSEVSSHFFPLSEDAPSEWQKSNVVMHVMLYCI